MATSPISRLIERLRLTLALNDEAVLTDAQLLTRFIEERDDAAFAAIARRHGPMVMGVCLRLTRNHHDAEDAFQSTFLVLIRKAASIGSRAMLPNWLYRVANKAALQARSAANRRKARETQVDQMPETAVAENEPFASEALSLLDQELRRLPDKYRVAIILCEIEGKTQKHAAEQLGCSETALSSRLSRARRLLAKRLARHGLAVTAESFTGILTPTSASARVPMGLLFKTVKHAIMFESGQGITGVIPDRVLELAQGALKTMLMKKLSMASVVMIVVALVTFRVAAYSSSAWGQSQNESAATKQGVEKEAVGSEPKEAVRSVVQKTDETSEIVTDVSKQKAVMRVILQAILDNHARLQSWSGEYSRKSFSFPAGGVGGNPTSGTFAFSLDCKANMLATTHSIGNNSRRQVVITPDLVYYSDSDDPSRQRDFVKRSKKDADTKAYPIYTIDPRDFFFDGSSASPKVLEAWLGINADDFRTRVRLEKRRQSGEELVTLTMRFGGGNVMFDDSGSLFLTSVYSSTWSYHPIHDATRFHNGNETQVRAKSYRRVDGIVVPETYHEVRYSREMRLTSDVRYALLSTKVNQAFPEGSFTHAYLATSAGDRLHDKTTGSVFVFDDRKQLLMPEQYRNWVDERKQAK